MKAPIRAFRLTLELGADTRRDMAWALRNLAHRIEAEKCGGAGTWGCPSDGANYELLTDPTMTHERFFAELHAYLDALPKVNESAEQEQAGTQHQEGATPRPNMAHIDLESGLGLTG